MDACELSKFINPCERTPGAPESPSNWWYAVCPVGGQIAPLRIHFNPVR
jgi:hypothetical protein